MTPRERTKDWPDNPFRGKKLREVLEYLLGVYGWEELGEIIDINCFNNNPSMKSSLGFLRKEEWARVQVEKLYLDTYLDSKSLETSNEDSNEVVE